MLFLVPYCYSLKKLFLLFFQPSASCLCLRVSLFRRFLIPMNGFLQVWLDTFALFVHTSYGILRLGHMGGTCRNQIALKSFLQIPFPLIYLAQVVPHFYMSLCDALPVPFLHGRNLRIYTAFIPQALRLLECLFVSRFPSLQVAFPSL